MSSDLVIQFTGDQYFEDKFELATKMELLIKRSPNYTTYVNRGTVVSAMSALLIENGVINTNYLYSLRWNGKSFSISEAKELPSYDLGSYYHVGDADADL